MKTLHIEVETVIHEIMQEYNIKKYAFLLYIWINTSKGNMLLITTIITQSKAPAVYFLT